MAKKVIKKNYRTSQVWMIILSIISSAAFGFGFYQGYGLDNVEIPAYITTNLTYFLIGYGVLMLFLILFSGLIKNKATSIIFFIIKNVLMLGLPITILVLAVIYNKSVLSEYFDWLASSQLIKILSWIFIPITLLVTVILLMVDIAPLLIYFLSFIVALIAFFVHIAYMKKRYAHPKDKPKKHLIDKDDSNNNGNDNSDDVLEYINFDNENEPH